MTRKTYTAEYKTKLVLEVIREESRLEEIAAENEINPNMLRNWKQEFLQNASKAFEKKESKAAAGRRTDAADRCAPYGISLLRQQKASDQTS